MIFFLKKGRNHRFQLISPKHLFLLKFLAATRVLFFPQFCSKKKIGYFFQKSPKLVEFPLEKTPKNPKNSPNFFSP